MTPKGLSGQSGGHPQLWRDVSICAAVGEKPAEQRPPEGAGRLARFPGDVALRATASRALSPLSSLTRVLGRHALVTLSN